MTTNSGILGNERDPDDPIIDVCDPRDDSETVTDETATPGDAAQPKLALPGIDALAVTVRELASGRALGRSDLVESPCEETRSRLDRVSNRRAYGAHRP